MSSVAGFASLGDGDRADGAAEDEPVEIGLHRDVQHASQAFDVGFEQRRGVTQIKAGVHHAVEHHIEVGHRRAQRVLVVKVAVAAFDVEVVDRHRAARLAEVDTDVVAALNELSRDMGSDEAARAHHKDLARRRFSRHEAFFSSGGE